MSEETYKLQLFGPFQLRRGYAESIEIKGIKHRALIAVLARAPGRRHSRRWLQELLWGRSGHELGRASLRRALTEIRKDIGEDFDTLFSLTQQEIALCPDRLEEVGSREDGEFLEGFRISETKFLNWLDEQRSKILQVSMTVRGRAIGGQDQTLVPTVAVIPFLPRVAQQDAKVFSDMVAMEVSRSISRSRLFSVISHFSARKFAGTELDIETLTDHLDADYLLTSYARKLVTA